MILYNDARNWELRFNEWLVDSAGQLPAHYINIESSALVEDVVRGKNLTLYKLKDFTETNGR